MEWNVYWDGDLDLAGGALSPGRDYTITVTGTNTDNLVELTTSFILTIKSPCLLSDHIEIIHPVILPETASYTINAAPLEIASFSLLEVQTMPNPT